MDEKSGNTAALIADKRTRKMAHVKVPGSTVRLLGSPSKMPGYSWSMQAKVSCPYSLFGEGTICGHCYALRGRYRFGNVKNALGARWEWAKTCMRSDEGQAAFVATMVAGITEAYDGVPMADRYFRIHDAGDFFNVRYVDAWYQIAKALPDIRFWAPTRSYRAPWVLQLVRLASLPNVTVRPSALHFNEDAPTVPGLAFGSGAGSDGYTCPASTQGNACVDCRKCWDAPDMAIIYKAH